MRSQRTSLLILFFLGRAVLSSVHGQVTTGQIQGTVTDTQAAVIPGVEVQVVNVATGQRFTATSNETGEFRVRSLPVGIYIVETELPGFKRYVRRGVELTANQIARLNIVLEVGEITEVVSVTEALSPVNATTSTLETLVEKKQMLNLPLAGRRNVLGLTTLMPGVGRVALADGASFSQQRINVNGARSYSTNVTLDGASMYYAHRGQALIQPPPEALQEVKVITSGVGAEFGRGAAVVSAITRSGSNEFHGSLWNYLRNDAFDARSFFSRSVPKLRYNQFGGTLGGPIRRNRAFFFFSYQGVEQRSDIVQSSAFPPTREEREGDFSKTRDEKPEDPVTGALFPGNIIPAERYDPVARKILELFPLPNQPNGRYIAQRSRAQSTRMFLGRVDYDFSQADRTTVRYFFDNPKASNPFGRGNIDTYGAQTSSNRAQNIALSHRRAFSPQLLLSARFGYTRFLYREGFSPEMSLADLGAKFVTGGGPPALPRLAISGRLTAAPGKDDRRLSRSQDAGADLSWFRGRHEIKLGFSFQRNRFTLNLHGRSQGEFTFDGSFTRSPVADFLLGQVSLLRQEAFRTNDAYYSIYGFYLQDQWRATPRLSLTLGLRWEIYEPFRTPDGRFGAFVPGAKSSFVPNAPAGLVYDRDAAFPLQRDALNAGPRIGFAYDLFGNGKTSIRGGYGISYDPLIGQVATQNVQPFGGDLATSNVGPLSDPQRFVDLPFGRATDLRNATFVLPVSMSNSFVGKPRVPYAQNLNLTVEQELWGGTLLQLSYAGTLGRKISIGQEQNPAVFIPGQSTLRNADQRRIHAPVFGSIYAYSTDANSSYHGLQVLLQRRFAQNLGFSVGYAYAKAIDEVGTSEVAHWAAQNPENRRGDRGLSDFDIRQRLVVSWVYDLPRLAASPGLVRHAFGGWQFAGLGSVQDGRPFTVVSGRNNSLRGLVRSSDRPDLLGDPRLPTDRSRAERISRYFDTSRFTMNRTGQFGNAGRNILIGPGSVDFDLSLKKRIFLAEAKMLEFRWEMFNAFNRPNFGQPRNNLASKGTFGRITGAGSGRIMQFGLKFEF